MSGSTRRLGQRFGLVGLALAAALALTAGGATPAVARDGHHGGWNQGRGHGNAYRGGWDHQRHGGDWGRRGYYRGGGGPYYRGYYGGYYGGYAPGYYYPPPAYYYPPYYYGPNLYFGLGF